MQRGWSAVMSGIQPSGQVHLGNYFGAVANWCRLQEQYDNVFFSVVDLHSLTAIPSRTHASGDFSELKKKVPRNIGESTREMMATLLACGINPQKAVLFPQSMVSGHAELSWMLSCLTPTPWLERMIQYKEKKKMRSGSASLALLSYPVLMSADILLYRATHIPVGEDQMQHLELARDIAHTFNCMYGEEGEVVLPLPQGIQTSFGRVMSLRDGNKKMSKSDPVEASRIHLTDTPDQIAFKIRKAKTDTITHLEENLDQQPELRNLVQIYASLIGEEYEETVREVQGMDIASFKRTLTDAAISQLGPIRERTESLLQGNAREELDAVIKDGVNRATAHSFDTLQLIRQRMGLSCM